MVPAAKDDTSRPPWQRLLQGADAKKAAELSTRVESAWQAGKWEEALRAAEELVQLRQQVQGKEHWEAVNARWQVKGLHAAQRQTKEAQTEYASLPELDQQGQALEGSGRAGEAEAVRRKALAIRRKVLGEDHPDTAGSYNNVAMNLNFQGKYAAAEDGLRKALQMRRQVLGEEHPQTAESYNNVAFNLHSQGKYPAAEEGFRKAQDIWRKVLGEEHSDTAISYNNLAANLNSQGKYAAAEEACRKAITIWRKVLGEEHAYTATSYDTLAVNLNAQGKYVAAEESCRRALTIYRKILGEEHPDTAQSYNNLAGNLNAQGQYTAAAESYRKALTIFRKVLGEEHPLTAQGYNDLAVNLNDQGQYAAAEEGYQKALEIRRKVLGEEHPSTAISYNNVAVNLHTLGQYAAAAENYNKALAIYRKVFGDEHINTATCYNNLAANLRAQGQYAAAMEGFRKALAIRRKMFGEVHSHTATSYHDMAVNLTAQGKYEEAEEDFRKALIIFREVLGEENLDTTISSNNLAATLNAQGKYAAAEQLWLQGTAGFATARSRLAHSGLQRATISGERSPLLPLAAVLARNGKTSQAWQRYEESLARGTWDDLSARLRRPAAEQARQTTLILQLDQLDQLIARAVAVKDETAQEKKQRENLLGQRRKAQEELDALIAHLEKSYGPGAGKVFDIPRIQAALTEDMALVGWIDRKPAGPKAADPNGEHWAFLLRRNGGPVCVRLQGSGDGGTWTEKDSNLSTDLLMALQERRPGWDRLTQRLHQQRILPLAKHLAGDDSLPAVRRLVVLPSSGLAGVPVELFAAEYTVSYTLSGTLYAHLHSLPRLTSAGLLALADPAFDFPPSPDRPSPSLPDRGVLLTAVLPGSNAARARLRPGDVLLRYHDTDLEGPADFKPLPEGDAAKEVAVTVWRDGKTFDRRLQPGKLGVVLAKEPAPRALTDQREQDRRLAALREEKWVRLPGTRVEADALRRLFATDNKAEVLLGSQASEQRLDDMAKAGALAKYRYLHLATHGEVDHSWPLRSAVLLARDHLPDAGKQLEAGLPVYDGKLTAEEVLRQWNLQSELVTLSACQSALGRYEHGEGFVGFAQAFLLCGSRSVCLSLWPVDDAATALLMQRFYANLLGKCEGLKAPLGKAAALAEAKAWLRNLAADEALALSASLRQGIVRSKRPATPREAPADEKPVFTRGAKPYAHPYYWAAFVLIGDPD
jgi:tetratricopeptide (TPR) repeat protein